MRLHVGWTAALLALPLLGGCGAPDAVGGDRQPVLGGAPSGDGRAVLVYRQDKTVPSRTRACTAALLCEDFALTAMHCIDDALLGPDPDLLRLTDAARPATPILAAQDVPGARRVETVETYEVDGGDGYLFVKLKQGSYFPEPKAGGRFFSLAGSGSFAAGTGFQIAGYGANRGGGTGGFGSDGSGERRQGNLTFQATQPGASGEPVKLAFTPGTLGGAATSACPPVDSGAPLVFSDRLTGIHAGSIYASGAAQDCASVIGDRAFSTVFSRGASAIRAKMAEWCPPRSGLRIVPGIFDTQSTATVRAAWQSGAGLPSDDDPKAAALVLDKLGPTSAYAFAEGNVQGLDPFDASLLELGFDYPAGSHCGAGAPRFNVTTTDGSIRFFACYYGRKSPGPAAGWTHVSFTAADADFAFDPGDVVTGIRIIMDEGADQGGHAVLDNIRINGAVVGRDGTVY